MFDARYIEADAPPRRLRAEDYRADLHRGGTLCGDFNCGARLHYRRQSMRFGNVIYRFPHFVTYKGEKHIDGCTHYNPSTDEKALRSVAAALAAGRKILINLNMDLGLPQATGGDPHDPATPYGRFLARNNHLALSVKSVSDMLRVRETLLRAGGEEALRRTYVGHQLELRRFENVFIGDDRKKLRALFNAMAGGEGIICRGPRSVVTGFPRVFLFEPTKKTSDRGTRAAHVNGNSQCISGPGEPGVMLLQTLGLHDSGVRRDILEGGPAYVMAPPVLDVAAGFTRGGKNFVRLDWRVGAESQYAGVPAAQPKLL